MKKADYVTVALILVVNFAMAIIISNVVHNFTFGMKFFFTYTFVLLPAIPWVLMIENIELSEKILILNLIGLGVVPILLFIYGSIGLYYNKVIYFGLPIVIFVIGLWKYIKKD